MDKVINQEFKIIKSLGKGHSTQVYEAVSIKNGKRYAIKLQKTNKSDSILRQATILMNLQQKNNLIIDYGVPFCYLAGTIDSQNYEVIDLYSCNLKTMLKLFSGIFTINTFMMIADQTLKRLQFLHRNSYIHRSISLKKFLIGLEHNNTKIYLNGFGNGKKYINDTIHIPYKEGKKNKGNLLYKSINCHLGLQASRRDDLQSLVYCWAHLLFGSLPWLKEKDEQKILSKKVQNRGQILFANFPTQLQNICDYAKNLTFDEEIDYQKIKIWIIQLFQFYNLEYNYQFDWLQQKYKDKISQIDQ